MKQILSTNNNNILSCTYANFAVETEIQDEKKTYVYLFDVRVCYYVDFVLNLLDYLICTVKFIILYTTNWNVYVMLYKILALDSER